MGPICFQDFAKRIPLRLFAPIKKLEKSLLVFAPYCKRDNYAVKGKTYDDQSIKKKSGGTSGYKVNFFFKILTFFLVDWLLAKV